MKKYLLIAHYVEGIVLRARDMEINETNKIYVFKKVIIYWLDIEYIHIYRYIYIMYININVYIYVYIHIYAIKYTTKIPNNDKCPAEN